SSGTGTDANIPDLPVAGKTGTTDNDQGAANNSWFSGYTTNYTIAVWSGYDDNARPLVTQDVSKAIFKNTMTKLSKEIETKDFEKPDSVVSVKIEKGSNPPLLPSDLTPDEQTITELFVKGTEPKKEAEE